jgi:hypothetical protein
MEEAVPKKGLNFSVSNSHSYMIIVCAVESAASDLPQTLGMEFRCRIRSVLEKSKSSKPNVTKKELRALKFLRLNKDIRIV